MEREDLRKNIIPTVLENTDENSKFGNPEFNTKDLIWIESSKGQGNSSKEIYARRLSTTDHAKANNVNIQESHARNGKCTTWTFLRDSLSNEEVHCILEDGELGACYTNYSNGGLCPLLHYKIPSENETSKLQIKEVKDTKGNVIYHVIQIAEYPKTKENEELSRKLELLYHGGKTKDGIDCTGRWYSTNGEKNRNKNYAGRHSPEFEYEGKRYVREIAYHCELEEQIGHEEYLDGTKLGIPGNAKWMRVEPISFIIRNWDEMPKYINSKGKGNAKYLDLKAEEAITSNISFYPVKNVYQVDKNSTMWQNSTIRGFFNGIDVRNIRNKWKS